MQYDELDEELLKELIQNYLERIWKTMHDSVESGLKQTGEMRNSEKMA